MPPLDSEDSEKTTAAVSAGPNFPVVGIGASAGGLSAIITVLENLPSDCGMAIVIVIHLSPRHESNASAILQGSTRMPVQQVQGEVEILANNVYVIPPTQDLAMFDGHLRIADAVRPRGRHIVIDTFFRSLAEAHADRAVGVVLSGTGADGSAGIAWLKQNGGVVIAQSPDDAEHDGMPNSAIATGNVDMVLPAAEIAQRLTEIWRNAQQIEMPDPERSGLHARAASAPEAAEDALRDVMASLRVRTGHDFKHYKRATILRRIERRLQVVATAHPADYRDYLHSHPDEARALLDDLLIGVTQFFRDRRAFETLEREILPSLVSALHDDDQMRVWVPPARPARKPIRSPCWSARRWPVRGARASSRCSRPTSTSARSRPHARAAIRRRSSPTCRRRVCAATSRKKAAPGASPSRSATRWCSRCTTCSAIRRSRGST